MQCSSFPSYRFQTLAGSSSRMSRQNPRFGNLHPPNALERFFITLPEFDRDPQWASMMHAMVRKSLQKLQNHDYTVAGEMVYDMGRTYKQYYLEEFKKAHPEAFPGTAYGVPRCPTQHRYWKPCTPIDVPRGDDPTRYQPIREEALNYLGKQFKVHYLTLKYKLKQAHLNPWQALWIKKTLETGKVITLQTAEGPIPMTRICLRGEELVWIPTPVQHIAAILETVNTLFQEILKLKTTSFNPTIKQHIIDHVARMHYRLVHAMPFLRGSAAISDAFTKVLFDSFEIDTPKWKAGISPDMKALTRDEEDFVKEYGSYFEQPL